RQRAYDANFGFPFTFFALLGTLSTTAVGGSSVLFIRLMIICWPKLTTLPKSQYNSRPAGAVHIIQSIIAGIRYVIILCCICCSGDTAGGVGVNFVARINEPAKANSDTCHGPAADRAGSHRKLACRASSAMVMAV